MQFAYLTAQEYSRGMELRQSPYGMQVNETALVKAKTFLAYCIDNELVTSNSFLINNQRWTYYAVGYFGANDVELPRTRDNIAAVIPVKFRSPVWEQPGIALVRSDFEIASLFQDFLAGSRSWLRKRPDEIKRIEDFLNTPVAKAS